MDFNASTPVGRPRPVLLLDVDGVLNVQARGIDLAWETHDVLGPGDQRTFTLVINPTHGIWLRDLAAYYDLVWATTWWTVANERIAPLLGLPPLSSVPLPTPLTDIPTDYSAKTPHVRRWAAHERPDCTVAWLDDDIDERDADALTGDWSGQPGHDMGETPPVRAALTLNVNPSIGLTYAHVEKLRSWARRLP